jgi:hypothetical protein
MAKQQFNRRLSEEAIRAISWWAKQDSTPARKVTDTEIVERAIAFYDEMRQGGGVVEEFGSERHVVSASQVSRVPPETQTVPPRSLEELSAAGLVSKGPPGGQFPCRCIHSGCHGAKFLGASKFANLCPECAENGHIGDVRDCPQCWQPV